MDENEIDKAINKKKDYYVELIKEEMKESIESGMLKPEQQFALIEQILKDLVGHKRINEEAVQHHKNEVKKLLKEIDDKQTEISERYKKTYEKILEL